MERKAEMGVGTLIIFISLLLVAAVAAGVLIQTAGTLQQKALSTGNQATGQIATNAVALEVSAEDGTVSGGVQDFTMILKLAPGSNLMNLNEVTLTYATTTESATYELLPRLNDSNYCAADPDPQDCTQVNGEAGNFTVHYLQTGANHQEGLLVRGDVVKLYFQAPSQVDEAEYVRINLIPKIGVPTHVQFDTPDVMATQQVYLYP